MPARPSMAQRQRDDYDYANIGKVGRRTGVTLAPRTLDEHGLEEMSGMFSSPRKPSPAQASNKRLIMESVEEVAAKQTPRAADKPTTPSTAKSLRRSTRGSSHPLPRSASPRKSGITGSARRSGADVLVQRQLEHEMEEVTEEAEHVKDTQLFATPSQVVSARAASARPATMRRFSPDRTPLRNRVMDRQAKSAQVSRVSDVQPVMDLEPVEEEQPDDTPSHVQTTNVEPTAGLDVPELDMEVEDDVKVIADDQGGEQETRQDMEALAEQEGDDASISEPEPEELDLPPPPTTEQDDEDEDATFEPPTHVVSRKSQQVKANCRRKRKSDTMEDAEAATISSPAAKRAKRRSTEGTRTSPRSAVRIPQEQEQEPTSESTHFAPRQRGRKPLAKKDTNTKLSAHQQKEVDQAVEKIRSRPGQKKSLFLLRRETPADDSVTHTRSGRISIKPLAWWRNEGIVYGGSPAQHGRGVADGARFPLNSIKEIVRKDEVVEQVRHGGRSKNKRKAKSKLQQADDDSDLDLEGDGEEVDPEADDWELDTGTLRGDVSIWDPEQQAPIEEEETLDIAHAAAAIQTKEVKGSTFQYAKLLSTRFFGTGVVDLPPGGIKKPKNSRKMHMSFFVAQGRVTVEVGPLSGQLSRFSIGKGGFWQVPRGNQYSIENEHGKSARIFFSQACEPAPGDSLEE